MTTNCINETSLEGFMGYPTVRGPDTERVLLTAERALAGPGDVPRTRIFLFVSLLLLSWGRELPALQGGENSSREPASKVLRIALDTKREMEDPHEITSEVEFGVFRHLYDSMVGFSNTGEIIPGLALSWEMSGPRSWRFHLREKGPSGIPVETDANDVVYTFNRIRAMPRTPLHSHLKKILEDVRVIEPHVVEISLKTPDPLILAEITYVFILPEWGRGDGTYPEGTGPFRLCSEVTDETMTFCARDSYWNGTPPWDKVEIRFVTQHRERAQMLLDGIVDLVAPLNPADVPAVESRTDLWVDSQLGVRVHYLRLDPSIEPLTDLRVRRAISLGIGRRQLVEESFWNYARPAYQMVHPAALGFVRDLEGSPDPDQDEARSLLREAGFEKGLTLKAPVRREIGSVHRVVQRQLAEIGIQIVWEPHSGVDWPGVFLRQEIPIAVLSWAETTLDGGNTFRYLARSRDSDEVYYSGYGARFSNLEIERLIVASDRETSSSEREKMIQEVSKIVAEDSVYVPLVWAMDLYGVRRSLEWRPRLDGQIRAWEVHERRDLMSDSN